MMQLFLFGFIYAIHFLSVSCQSPNFNVLPLFLIINVPLCLDQYICHFLYWKEDANRLYVATVVELYLRIQKEANIYC